jgi:hypothetical protein
MKSRVYWTGKGWIEKKNLNKLDYFLQNSTVRLEYVENFDLSGIPKQPNDFGDMLDETCFDSYINQLNNRVAADDIPTLPRFYERRYFVEDILKNGILHPVNAEAYKSKKISLKILKDKNDNKVAFLIHPGQKRLHMAQLLNWKFLSIFIFSPKSEKINFGGVEIKNSKDFTNLELYKKYQKEKIDWSFNSGSIWTEFYDNNIKGMGIDTKGELCNTGYGKQKSRDQYIREVYNFEDRKKYIQLVKNSLPLLIFKDIPANDIYNIPKKNNFKGMVVYIDSKFKWETGRDLWELFYFGKVEKAICKGNDDSVILFNCEHPFWKTDNDISKLKNQEIGFLPDYS